jgi:membrane fusion protein, copper/silver efflux system
MNRLTILIITSLLLFSCSNSGNTENPGDKDSSKTESKTTDMEYTCPMHPEVVRKEVGTCPECGMELQIRS